MFSEKLITPDLRGSNFISLARMKRRGLSTRGDRTTGLSGTDLDRSVPFFLSNNARRAAHHRDPRAPANSNPITSIHENKLSLLLVSCGYI
jgi:hypothetical protein